MPRVSVGLVGDPTLTAGPAEGGGSIQQTDWLTKWEDRQRIELEVDLSETLAGIKNRAAHEFGIPRPQWGQHHAEVGEAFPFVAFYSESRPGQMTQPAMFVTVVDERGRAIWNVSPGTVRFEQLARAAELGALGGSADRIYFLLLPPSGNGVYVDWSGLLDALRVTWDLLEAIDTFVGAAAGMEFVRRKLRDRLTEGRDAIQRNAPEWSQRNALPHDLSTLLKRRSWTLEEAAGLLGVDEAEAAQVLEVFGLARDPEDGRWYRGGDQAGALLDQVSEEFWSYPPSEHPGISRIRLDELLRTGETMPSPDYRESQFAKHLPDESGFDWDPDRDTRLTAAVLVLGILLAALIVAVAVEDGFLSRAGAAALTLVVAFIIVRSRIFSAVARWLATRT